MKHYHCILTLNINAINNSVIATDGLNYFTINFGLKRRFQWLFWIAHVRYAILRANFSTHFNLLVVMQHYRLVHSITGLIVDGFISPPLALNPTSVKLLASTCMDFLTEFLEISTEASMNMAPKQTGTHCIATTGRRLHSRPRRLDPGELRVALTLQQNILCQYQACGRRRRMLPKRNNYW